MMGVSVSHDCACAGEERMATRTYYDCAAGWLRWAVAGSWVRGGGWLHGRTTAVLAAGLEVDGCCTDVQLRALLAG